MLLQVKVFSKAIRVFRLYLNKSKKEINEWFDAIIYARKINLLNKSLLFFLGGGQIPDQIV